MNAPRRALDVTGPVTNVVPKRSVLDRVAPYATGTLGLIAMGLLAGAGVAFR